MATVNYEVAHIRRCALPQDSGVTCWAACIATTQGCRAGRMLLENQVLGEPYISWWRAQRSVTPEEIASCYGSFGYTTGSVPVTSARACADFIIARAPIIVCSAIVTWNASGAQHQGYHVRVIYGCVGDPDSSTENDFQVLIFDPFPQEGFRSMQGYLFSHFKLQMTLRTGPRSEVVGRCWHYR